jgi:arsenate reductase
MEIWVNPACSKCRTATAELDAAGVEYTVRRYLEDPPTVEELTDVLARMGLDPWDVARTADVRAAGIDLPRDAEHRERWIEAMVAEPRTIQRPIITASDGTTAVARDAATVTAMVERG